MTRLAPLALLCALPVAAAAEIPPIGRLSVVTEGLIDTAIAYEVDRVCDSLDGRFIMGLAFLTSLRGYAANQGFSADEIEAYIDDDQEKERLIAIARQRLSDLGAVEGEPETYCAVGRAEIAKDSQIGRLLAD